MIRKSAMAVLLFTAILVTGCKEASNPAAPVPDKFAALNPSVAFKWTTVNFVRLKVTGIETIVPVAGTLIIYTQDGQPLLTTAHILNQDFEGLVAIPAHVSAIKIKFGTIEREAVVNKGSMQVALAAPFDNGEAN